ncbi:MAG: hypothetical protein ACOY0T_27710 [Myxococcota bacterium]
MKSSLSRLLRCVPLLGLLAASVASCQSIAGIEDYHQGHCGEFCDAVMANCTGPNEVYHSRASCMGFCALLREGDFTEKDTGNTVACRLDAALGVPNGEANQLCQWAGPGGGDHCGDSNCANYCALFPKVCPEQAEDQEPCITNCQGLRDDLHLNSTDDHEGDTIQCRLVHLSAATAEPASHCGHARLAKPSAYCTDEALPTPHPLSCDDYCKLVGAVCNGKNAVYEDTDQCKAVCKYFEVGEPGDQTGDTLACRKYHVQNAISLPATHCAHAGPGGDGHCGDTVTGSCGAYCSLLSQICPTEFSSTLTDLDGCMADCTALEDSASNKAYSVEKTLHPTSPLPYGCRLLALSRAAVDKNLCSVVFEPTACL